MLDLCPSSASIENGELAIAGVGVRALADERGTPLVVYCERTIRERARAYRAAAPAATVVYGTKAFPNLAVLRLLVEEGLGADVSTTGELEFALRAGVPPELLVVHGNNKSDEELSGAARVGAGLVVLDAPDEVERAAAAGILRVLLRLTPGIDAQTHDSIRTGHAGSKFGFTPDAALGAIRRGRDAGLEIAGVHVHLGSQLVDAAAGWATVAWLADFGARARRELEWTPSVVDLGGGLGVRHVADDPEPSIAPFVRELLSRLEDALAARGLPVPHAVLEPGRSIVGPAGVTIYRVGVVKRAGDGTAWVAVDGGMSDNPRPQLYGARYAALLANRMLEPPAGRFAVAGKHCESGDVLIRDAALPEPRRGDLLAVPATGAYTLAMASNYNGVPRPAAVLVSDGEARVIRRRESVEDLLAYEC